MGTMPQREIVASSDAYGRGYHKGNSGGLDAVDTDLAAANIKSDVTIFGKEGTVVPTEDVTGTAATTLNNDNLSDGTWYYGTEAISAGGDLTIASKTLIFASLSMAVAAGYYFGRASITTKLKMQVVMGGVQAAESGYIDEMVYAKNFIVVGTRSLEGSQECLIRVHNYDTSAQSIKSLNKAPYAVMAAGIAVGSVKI